MSSGQSYVMPMMSHDVIGMIEGDGVVLRGRGGSWKVDQLGDLNNPSHFK